MAEYRTPSQSPQWTLRQLAVSTKRLQPFVRDSNRLYDVYVAPSVRTKRVIIRGVTDPLTDRDARPYRLTIVFYGVAMTDAPGSEGFPLVGRDTLTNQRVGIERLSLSQHKVQLRCGCQNFRFRWHWYDHKNAALAGPVWPPYKRKTPPPPIGYPYANPLKVPGICKHLTRLIAFLVAKKVLR